MALAGDMGMAHCVNGTKTIGTRTVRTAHTARATHRVTVFLSGQVYVQYLACERCANRAVASWARPTNHGPTPYTTKVETL